MNAMRKHVEELYEKIKEAFVDEEEEEQELYVDYIQGVLKNCSEYATFVAQQEQRIQVARFRMEPNDYREFVQNIDYNRRLAHNCLMKGVDKLNNWCAKFGVAKIAYEVDPKDRESYGTFALRVVNEYFKKMAA